MTAAQLEFDVPAAIANRNAVMRLLELDPDADGHTVAVARAIDLVADPGDLVSANEIRAHLPAWTNRALLGQAWGKLCRARILAKVDWIPSTDPGTHGKPVTRYRVLEPVAPAAAHLTDPRKDHR